MPIRCPRKLLVYPTDGHRFDNAFGCVVVQFAVAIFEKFPCLWHPIKGVADGFGMDDLPEILGNCACGSASRSSKIGLHAPDMVHSKPE